MAKERLQSRINAETVWGTSDGGTGNSTYLKGDMLVAFGANKLSRIPVGGASQVLGVSNGVPAWITSSQLPPISSVSNGDTLYYNNGWQTLNIGTNGYIMQSDGSKPKWFNLFGTSNSWTAKQDFSGTNGIDIGGWTFKTDGTDLVLLDPNNQEQHRWYSS